MLELDLPSREPTLVSEEAIGWPSTLHLAFEGFSPEAFALLKRLRENPHIEQYRLEKEAIRQYLTEPFKRYRDDLVVNWVLPNRLALETEKNVFSRLLKNDFGAGGCHHHLWMAFYRPDRRRLTDVQLSHSINPDGFSIGLYVGGYAKDLLRQAKDRIVTAPDTFRLLLNALLTKDYCFSYYTGTGAGETLHVNNTPLDAVPEDLPNATSLWIRTVFPRADVLRWQGQLVAHALEGIRTLWPLYSFLVSPP